MTSRDHDHACISRGPSDRCWPISRERKVVEIVKLVMPRTIMCTSYKVKGPKVKVDHQVDYCWDRKCIISTEREGLYMNFKIGTPIQHALSTATASYKGLWNWVFASGRGNTVPAAPGDHKLVSIALSETQVFATKQHVSWKSGPYNFCPLQL